ncbi:protein of unknown function [Legionella hackeliae]|uniref:Uncharacterized protein n=1 Tax=Legionella hackeliae TaxID=449 RepID=A0A0A8UQT8_LEGHA|nr:protein of unknown function [Legionella hackeliae]
MVAWILLVFTKSAILTHFFLYREKSLMYSLQLLNNSWFVVGVKRECNLFSLMIVNSTDTFINELT